MDIDANEQTNRMIEEVFALPGHIEKSIHMNIALTRTYAKIAVFGMGGSSIGGEVLENMLCGYGNCNLTRFENNTLPGWVDEDTLLICCSYSGNTAETLSIYEQAHIRNIDTISITVGGKLESLSQKNGSQVINLPQGLQPRNVIGYFIGTIASIIRSNGWIDISDELLSAASTVKGYCDEIFDNREYVYSIADLIDEHICGIYSSPDLSSVTDRWRNQFTENSKRIAFSGTIPEFNHNQIVGWCNCGREKDMTTIILRESCMSDNLKGIMDATISVLKKNGVNPIVIDVEGDNILDCTLKAIILGDLISIRLARMNNVDPFEIDAIKELKNIMASDDRIFKG